MAKALIISAAKIIDGVGSLQHCLDLEKKIHQLGHPICDLTIEPLRADWHAPEKPGCFRSGCAPLEALDEAKNLILQGEKAVLIRGEDNIKTGYSRDERLKLMSVYGDSYPLTQAYTELAHCFCTQQGIDADTFKALANSLFENYQRSYCRGLSTDDCLSRLPADKWHRLITALFRGVDCANPLVDFSGRLLIVDNELANRLKVSAAQSIEVKAVGLSRLEGDGKDYLHEIAEYKHLRQAYEDCCAEADINFSSEFRHGRALLDVYTCYPVVPMAFLLASGLVDRLEELPQFLDTHNITVTGGMNLARAAWNNPALNGLITLCHHLLDGGQALGMVHGNGGLGYRQGVAILLR